MFCIWNYNIKIPGQGTLSLQVWCSVSFPVQLAPPYWAGIFVLFLPWVPPWQVEVQVSHVPHAFQVQFTRRIKITIQLICFLHDSEAVPGQGLALQVWFSVSFMAFGSVLFPAQAAPPFWAGFFVRFLSWVPPPQVAEHVSHVPHSFQVQLTKLIKIIINFNFGAPINN